MGFDSPAGSALEMLPLGQGAGHQKVMLVKNRMQVFHEILGFLDESGAAALKESGLHPVRP